MSSSSTTSDSTCAHNLNRLLYLQSSVEISFSILKFCAILIFIKFLTIVHTAESKVLPHSTVKKISRYGPKHTHSYSHIFNVTTLQMYKNFINAFSGNVSVFPLTHRGYSQLSFLSQLIIPKGKHQRSFTHQWMTAACDVCPTPNLINICFNIYCTAIMDELQYCGAADRTLTLRLMV
jgi:hypothetical protein